MYSTSKDIRQKNFAVFLKYLVKSSDNHCIIHFIKETHFSELRECYRRFVVTKFP